MSPIDQIFMKIVKQAAVYSEERSKWAFDKIDSATIQYLPYTD